MDKREAKEFGEQTGREMIESMDIPAIGDAIDDSLAWIGFGDVITEQNRFDYICTMAGYGEEANREIAPFEFTAHEFNESDDPDEMWSAYEDGVIDGMTEALRERGIVAPMVDEQ